MGCLKPTLPSIVCKYAINSWIPKISKDSQSTKRNWLVIEKPTVTILKLRNILHPWNYTPGFHPVCYIIKFLSTGSADSQVGWVRKALGFGRWYFFCCAKVQGIFFFLWGGGQGFMPFSGGMDEGSIDMNRYKHGSVRLSLTLTCDFLKIMSLHSTFIAPWSIKPPTKLQQDFCDAKHERLSSGGLKAQTRSFFTNCIPLSRNLKICG